MFCLRISFLSFGYLDCWMCLFCFVLHLWDPARVCGKHSGKHLGGIRKASGTPGGHWAAGRSESQKSMPLSAKIQKFFFTVNFTKSF